MEVEVEVEVEVEERKERNDARQDRWGRWLHVADKRGCTALATAAAVERAIVVQFMAGDYCPDTRGVFPRALDL